MPWMDIEDFIMLNLRVAELSRHGLYQGLCLIKKRLYQVKMLSMLVAYLFGCLLFTSLIRVHASTGY